MSLHGKLIIAGEPSADHPAAFKAINPATGQSIEPSFAKASDDEIDRAMNAAADAFQTYRTTTGEARAAFLEKIAANIEALGDELLERFTLESALPRGRAEGERARTCGQLRLFAAVARDGSWVDARIDTALPDRKPLPRPDIRRMLIPLGPVVVFSASNFPLAFSVAGGDTASALAAGCPVVCKTHWAHPGVSELVASAITNAAEESGMPAGVFSLIQGRGHEIGTGLARHPHTAAIGFTGSLRGGRALFDAAAQRETPIPVYAEMGSINPVFILPGAVQHRSEHIAKALVQSVTLGVGQFCTSPGLVIGLDDANFASLIDQTAHLIADSAPGSMLYDGLCHAYEEGVDRLTNSGGVKLISRSERVADATHTEGAPAVFRTDGKTFLSNDDLAEEVFGPATMFVAASSAKELEEIAYSLKGQLTATLHGNDYDLEQHTNLVRILEQKAGRVIFNSFPTGVEVCPAMTHGGPYPATSDSHFTSVGTAAILRFARPVSYQGFPQSALPPQLRDSNELNLWRLVNNQVTREPL